MGRFIVIEGTDGAGKSTQTKKLVEYFDKKGLSVKSFHFPSMEGFYGEMIGAFLRGKYGAADKVDPYFVAFAFAGDRKEMAHRLRQWIDEYDIVLLDRYALSNVAFQCAKLEDPAEQKKLREWILNLEFDVFNIPKPEVSLFLRVPLAFVDKQLARDRKGEERKYLRGASDVHEKDMRLQARVWEQYKILCDDYEEMLDVDCSDKTGGMLHKDRIHKKIVEILRKKGIL